MAKKQRQSALKKDGRAGTMPVVNFGEVTRRREALGLTMQQAAGAVGWTAQRWGDVERGRRPNPSIATVLAVARVLRCKVDQLLVKP